MFFNKKTKKENQEALNEEDLDKKIEKDLIVHNMPKENSLMGDTSNPVAAGKVSLMNSKEPNSKSKLIGALIIGGGLILISAIVFVTYRFVISPVAKEEVETNNVNIYDNKNNDIVSENEVNEKIDTENDQKDIIIDEVEIKINKKEDISTSTEDLMAEIVVLDNDKDGLSDKEEILIGTNLNISDTDEDGYNDLQEIKNSYNPIGLGALSDNKNLNNYSNNNYFLNFLYPRDFLIKTDDSDLFILETIKSSYFTLSISANSDNQGILTWYEMMFPDSDISSENLIQKDNFEALIGEDNLNLYITDKEKKYLYVLSYSPSDEDGLAFTNIFNIMINSFNINDIK